jgi:hypothetical protein
MMRMMAQIPRAAGTKAMIQVGWTKQLDSTSQNYLPRKFLQQPMRQKLGLEQLSFIDLNV